MKTLYVSDLDGTLLGTDSRVSERSAEIITELTKQGALITVATARTPATVEPLLRGVEIVPPAIVMTGASLWDHAACSYRDTQFIDAETAEAIMRLSMAHGVQPFVYTLADAGHLGVYKNGELSEHDRRFVDERRHLPLKHFYLNPDESEPPYGLKDIILFFAMGELERINSLAEELRLRVSCSVSNYVDIFGKDVGILEVFAPGISKAEAVRGVARECGAERIVAFGDNLNDLSMLGVADVAVAVENALPEVKQAADRVIGPNGADSVARFIWDDFMK